MNLQALPDFLLNNTKSLGKLWNFSFDFVWNLILNIWKFKGKLHIPTFLPKWIFHQGKFGNIWMFIQRYSFARQYWWVERPVSWNDCHKPWSNRILTETARSDLNFLLLIIWRLTRRNLIWLVRKYKKLYFNKEELLTLENLSMFCVDPWI